MSRFKVGQILECGDLINSGKSEGELVKVMAIQDDGALIIEWIGKGRISGAYNESNFRLPYTQPTSPCAAHDLETKFNESKALLLDELNELTDMLQNNGYSTNHITITEALTILNIILKK